MPICPGSQWGNGTMGQVSSSGDSSLPSLGPIGLKRGVVLKILLALSMHHGEGPVPSARELPMTVPMAQTSHNRGALRGNSAKSSKYLLPHHPLHTLKALRTLLTGVDPTCTHEPCGTVPALMWGNSPPTRAGRRQPLRADRRPSGGLEPPSPAENVFGVFVRLLSGSRHSTTLP